MDDRMKAWQATPHQTLLEQIEDCRVPKNEREHAAAREIERLRDALAAQNAEIESLDKINASQFAQAHADRKQVLASLAAKDAEIAELRTANAQMHKQASLVYAENERLREDAEKWRAYMARKNAVISAGMGRNPLREATKGTT